MQPNLNKSLYNCKATGLNVFGLSVAWLNQVPNARIMFCNTHLEDLMLISHDGEEKVIHA